jgi:hypothetical protein
LQIQVDKKFFLQGNGRPERTIAGAFSYFIAAGSWQRKVPKNQESCENKETWTSNGSQISVGFKRKTVLCGRIKPTPV